MDGDFIGDLSWRGLLHQTTSATLAAHLVEGGRLAYCGFDPTSDSLTVGNLLPILVLARWQQAGHRPLVVMGGATGLIGDPSGKSDERQLISAEKVRDNIARQQPIFGRILDFEGKNCARIVDNANWLLPLGFIDVLRDVGKHFSVNQMVARDSVASRLTAREQGISYTEFSYMILQAYDFLHLHRSLGCTVQLGGADQWGNICSGIDLIRRIAGGEAFGITNQLVTKSDGTKIGKSESGAIYLNADRTSAYRFHQFWLNASDEDAIKFLRWYTFLPKDAIDDLAQMHGRDPSARAPQKALADAVTALVHGDAERLRAHVCAAALFGGDIRGLDEQSARDIAADLPGAMLNGGDLAGDGRLVLDLLVDAGLAASKREARGFLESGAVQLNGERASVESRVTVASLLHGSFAFLRRGKRQWAVVRIDSTLSR
ncbi:MAG: tyrosine--tRNA ligase [Phycisphaerales bacterium]|nr:tyrosine--tRNA ligase [Phycisphaerales bacterium]